MDAQYYTGSDDRDDLAPDYRCDLCGCLLYPSERDDERCQRCAVIAADFAASLQAQHGKDAA
jgi:hypothetical protein